MFNRLYVNMIKAGEAGGALEIILQRLADFQERAEALKRKVKGAMIYPAVVITVAVGILVFIMLKIVPVFTKMFEEFGLTLPAATQLLIAMSEWVVKCWFLIPLIPVGICVDRSSWSASSGTAGSGGTCSSSRSRSWGC